MKQKIFVYGTLRKGMYNYDLYLKDEDSFRQYGYIKGSLMTIRGKAYPAYITEGQDMILGEIHEVSEKTLKLIDEMERYFGKGNPNNEYNKEICDIYDENIEIENFVYVYNMDNEDNVLLLGDDIHCPRLCSIYSTKKEMEKELFTSILKKNKLFSYSIISICMDFITSILS
ncbi:MAG: gamma-glutamylcyclotransferase [Longibaculum sp.]